MVKVIKNKTKPTHSQLHDINDHIPYIHPNEPPPSLTRVVTFNKQKMPSDSFESSHIHIKLLTHCVFNVPLIRLLCLTASVRLSCVQRQVSGEVRMQPQGSLVDPIAMTMATVGMGVSLYSARQMAERVHLKHLSA